MRRFRSILRRVVVAGLFITIAAPAAFAQAVPKKRKLNRKQSEEVPRLMRLVDGVAESNLPGGDAWLRLSSHFLRAPDGLTYIPFTVTIDEAPDGFEHVGLYIRVVERSEDDENEDSTAKLADTSGGQVGESPTSVPESQFGGRGNPTAGEHAAIAQSIESSLRRKRPARLPFEDVHFVDTAHLADQGPRYVRRALAVEAGTYDVYVAVKEFAENWPKDAAPPRSAVIKQPFVVPDLSGDTFTTSSVVLAERVELLPSPLSADDQLERPYALGNVEITPVQSNTFVPADELSLVFFAYNMASDAGTPDVTVQYRFYKVGIQDQLVVAGQPQLFNGQTLPPGFDIEAAGQQLPINIAVPLQSFPVGPYRLEIQVTDNLADAAITQNVAFIIEEGSE